MGLESHDVQGRPSPASSTTSASLDRVADADRDVLVHRCGAVIVTAGRLGPSVGWNVDADRAEQQIVDVAGRPAVGANEDDDRVIIVRPDREQPIAAVEVAAADVLEVGTSKAVAGRSAAGILELADDAKRSVASPSPKRTDMLVGDLGQGDVDRRLAFRSRSCAISAFKSSPSGTTFPARWSPRPSCTPGMSSSARSRSRCITSTRRLRS